MTNTPPEVLENWGEDFTKWINSQFWGECIQGKDRAEFLKVWIAARQTAVIELNRATTLDAQFYFVELSRLVREQGYRLEVK